MAWFKKKKDDVLDLTEYYNKRKAEMAGTEDETVDLTQTQDTSSNTTGFFGGICGSANSPTTEPTTETPSSDLNERKQKLAKRLKEMTDKLEDVSNQIYHLQQRLELVERKVDVNR